MIDIDLQRIHKNTQGDFSLDINCQIDSLVTGLFGPSGAGKSTLLSMIAGLVQPHSGHLILDGVCLYDSKRGINVPMHKRHISVVFQDSRLFPHLSIEDNLKYGFKLVPEASRRISFNKTIELLEIGHLLTQKPHQLSGGEKQRVALGRALLTSPRLLLLDEPLAALDGRLKQQILPFLRRVRDEIQIPMLYVSHAIDEILYLTPQVAMIENGKLLALGPFNEIVHQERVLALTHSLGLENILHAKLQAKHIESGHLIAKLGDQFLHVPLTSSLQQQDSDNVTVSIAASNIALALQKVSGITIQNQLACTVNAIQHIDHRVLVTVTLEASSHQLIAEVTAASLQNLQINVGSSLFCLIKTQSIHTLAPIY